MTLAESPLFYSTAEAAKLLNVSSQHVRNLVERGDIEARRFGRKILISKAELSRLQGGAFPADEALTSRNENADTIRELRRVLAEAQRLLAELDG